VSVRVPEEVTGEPDTVYIGVVEASDKATDVTVPEVAGAAHTGTPPDTVNTFALEPIGRRVFVAPDEL
jgi:hypothetical protein